MEVIVPERKGLKYIYWNLRSIEKKRMKQEIHFEELLENVQNFKAEPDKKILEFQEILERLITQELHAKKEGEDRWRTLDAASGDSRWQEEKQLHLRRRREKRKTECRMCLKKGSSIGSSPSCYHHLCGKINPR